MYKKAYLMIMVIPLLSCGLIISIYDVDLWYPLITTGSFFETCSTSDSIDEHRHGPKDLVYVDKSNCYNLGKDSQK